MGEGEKHDIQEIATNNNIMDGVLNVMEEINGWLYGYLGKQSVCDLTGGSLLGPSGCILKRGRYWEASFLEVFISSHACERV